MAIGTRDRPATLRRCLTSVIQGARASGRHLELLVMDDSRRPETCALNRDIAATAAAAAGFPVRYGSRAHRERLVAAMGRSPLAEVARFAFLGLPAVDNSCGANRNAILADTRGDVILAADDDVLWRIPHLEVTPGLALGPGRDLGELVPFEGWAEARRAAPWRARVDLPGLHEQLLGRTVADSILRHAPGGALDSDPLTPALFERIASGRLHTPITQMGFLGDPGLGSAFPYLLLEGASRERLLSSPARYRAACARAPALRRVPRLTISPGPYCMAYVLGIDNRRPLPPFFPVMRNSDGAFAACLRLCDPDALIGQIPHAILHCPPEPRRWRDEDVWSAPASWRVADLVRCALASARPGANAGATALGRALASLGGQALADFEDAVRAERRRREQRRVQSLERALSVHGARPDYWARDVARALDCARAETRRPELPLLQDLPHPPKQRRLFARDLILRFGALVSMWQPLVEAVDALRAGGVGLSEPLARTGALPLTQTP
jgi:hypothetical protein